MKKRTMLSFFCVSMLVLILGACNGKEGTKNNSKSKEVEQVATFSAMTPVQSLDPATAVDQTSITLLANVMEGLYRLDEKNQPQPAIAAGQPKISNNGKTYTIVIRDGAKWADGTDITADDFVTAWQRVVDPKTASPSVELFSAIKNAKEIASGKQSKETLAVKSNGNKTIEIELEKPTPYFTDLLAITAYYPVQQKAIKEYGKDYGTSQKSIVTNGAFNLTSLEGVGTSDKWTISKNKEYWDQKEVSMEKINFQVVKEINTGINLYNDGQLDDTPVTGEYAKQYKDNKEFSTTLMANTMYLELNQREKNSILKNKNVRKAISYAIDRSNYAKNILDNGSISAVGVVAKDVAFDPSTKKDFANKMLVHFVTEKAQSYWNKAKKELNIKEQVTLNILTNEEETTKKAAEYIQGQLEENLKGLKITITPVPANVQIERVMKHDFTISLSGWQADYPDPMSFLGNFESNSVLNFGGYSNTKYDEYLKDTSDKRWKSLKKAEELLLEDAGVVPFLQVGNSKLLKSTMRNIEMHSIGAKYDYKKMKRLE
ncbi:peptide ABC transporter substrate-binding protein [Enterococcus faecalis]|uniref:peptide ABC transporter substrate-binding protein n=1 Tax=Enterococcus faecalis TaxID=1351 RepID=UPI00300B336C